MIDMRCLFDIQMEMSSRQLDVRIQSSRERYRFGSHQHMAGILTFTATDWMRSEYVARADLLGLAVFRGQTEEEEQAKDTEKEWPRPKKENHASVMAWKPLDEDISRRGYGQQC